jgi:predicted transcriptional regulator
MKTIKIGIATQQQMRSRVLAIARGEVKPRPSDPKVWFTSMQSLAQVLSDENRALLQVIRLSRPQSISALAEMTGRKQGNLSRTLKTMSRYGLVEMRRAPNGGRTVQPVTQFSRYQIIAG